MSHVHVTARTNPNAQKFVEVASSFSPTWGPALEKHLEDNGLKDALDAIMNNRHQIAHGNDTGITVARVADYLDRWYELSNTVEGQCGLGDPY